MNEMFSHLMEDQCEFIRIFLIQFNEFLIKKIQIPVKKCNLSDYKWQFLLLLTYLYPYHPPNLLSSIEPALAVIFTNIPLWPPAPMEPSPF